MKSLRNLVCTVLMTMAIAVAGDGDRDEVSELDNRDRSVGGVTNTSTVDHIDDGEEGARQGCGRPGCPGCSGMPFPEFSSIGEVSVFLNALLLRGVTSRTSGGVVGEDADAAIARFLEALRSGRVEIVSFTPQTTAPVAPAGTTHSQQAPDYHIGE